MEIKSVFKTSKGLFWSFEEASKKQNRSKDTDPRSPGFNQYEPVEKTFVLMSDWGDKFELKQIEVK